jgi:predicted acyl esterase
MLLGCDDGTTPVDMVPEADMGLSPDVGADQTSVPLDDAEILPTDARPLPGPRAEFDIRIGVESVTVFGASAGAYLTLMSGEGTALLTLVADPIGQAHFAYIPAVFGVLDSVGAMGLSLASGDVLEAGIEYMIRDESTDPATWSDRFTVLSIQDIPDTALYEGQSLTGVHVSPIRGPQPEDESGYQYISVRDGVRLGAMVRYPDTAFYGEGPYPTVIEYSGYSPSRPDRLGAGTRIANALGYATVSVNMRGTGCSGGVFDFFNRAQHADGYDIVEVIARQPWVQNNRVGMVGLSYPGISQLYVASTNPPSLAAIVPLSTIADAWAMQWPGGIYNAGFTRQWVEARESDAAAGGASWVLGRIENGDMICEENLELSVHSLDFETILRSMSTRPARADDRDLNLLVREIEAPVFYGGQFHDEQTGAQFGAFLDGFHATRSLKVLLANGRHPDGFAIGAVSRWFEFLEFYVAGRIPEIHPVMRTVGAEQFGDLFGMTGAMFEADRFAGAATYEDALTAYESELPVRVLFESGAGSAAVGTPVPRFVGEYESWPVPQNETVQWYLAEDGHLASNPTAVEGLDAWRFDPEAGTDTFFGPRGYQLLVPIWDLDWRPFAEGLAVSFLTAPFEDAKIVAGPGIADLWIRTPVDDVTLQVTLTEIRPDGNEVLIQSGWLRLGHRKAVVGDDLRIIRSYSEADFTPMPMDEWVAIKVSIPSVAHPIRAGSALRMIISTPGRDHGTWEFEPPVYESPPTFEVGYGPNKPSSLTMAVIPDIAIPDAYPPCPSLRGQPCRPFEPTSSP